MKVETSIILWLIPFCTPLISPIYTSKRYHVVGRFMSLNSDELLKKATTTPHTDRKKHVKTVHRPKSQLNNTSTNKIQTWRIFEVLVHPDELVQSQFLEEDDDDDSSQSNQHNTTRPYDKMYLCTAVIESLMKRLKLPDTSNIDKVDELSKAQINSDAWKNYFIDIRVVRRSLDARRKRGGSSSSTDRDGPRYVYVLDVDITSSMAQKFKLKDTPGRLEKILSNPTIRKSNPPKSNVSTTLSPGHHKPTVVIVGAGPAGLFCALTLARTGSVHVVVLERGQAVESRGKSIGALIHRRSLDHESNFAFGEGGAGTWSDGKLTTRIGRNSESVRRVLETLVRFGAPEKILVDGAPHLGTDNLVRLLRNMRNELRDLGAEVRFGARMTNLIMDPDSRMVQGVQVEYGKSMERGAGGVAIENTKDQGRIECIQADRVVLATGHSARDVYDILHSCGVQLEPKGFAVGFRVEHPQKLINKIQYGEEWGACAYSGKVTTDTANREYFDSPFEHSGRLPVSSYRLATDKAFDGESFRGVFSFCQCPGGQIVLSSTDPNEICINGMSFSRRDSVWANAALVVTIDPDDPILESYRAQHGGLAGLAFQRDMEQRAAEMGGGNLVVPVQRVTDYINSVASTSAPTSSYRLGVKPSPCHEIYPQKINTAIKDALINYFNKQMPGFVSDDALLHAVETRTSSPVRISRDPTTKQAVGIGGLFPSGEGAGFAGGIISASVDGLTVAYSIIDSMDLSSSLVEDRVGCDRSIGYDYSY